MIAITLQKSPQTPFAPTPPKGNQECVKNKQRSRRSIPNQNHSKADGPQNHIVVMNCSDTSACPKLPVDGALVNATSILEGVKVDGVS